ncbi:MAG: hypothetical protein E4H09_02215 [Spirochaetales bacterium]|nr:MAG: hypothetical protein E4H09_02215 [Spirochaetales bacterium]
MDKTDLLHKYGISEDRFRESGVEWDDLRSIEEDYAAIRSGLESVGRYVVDALLKCPKVHSIKYRLKDAEHLVEKIIRKRLENPQRIITPDNYREQITDLVGIRALHLFKEDWLAVHTYIKDTWELSEPPLAYVRSGDSEKILDFYRQNDCEVREHRHGYRSVHYLISSSPDRERHTIEIQARTVFEEAWGEIDHVISYPYTQDNELLVRLSSVLNRLSANADELGSYMRYLKNQTDRMETEYGQTIQAKNLLISELQNKINMLEIDAGQKEALTSDLMALGKNRSDEVQLQGQYPWLEDLMESDLFKGLSERMERIMRSDEFRNVTLTEDDLQLLSKAQQDLLKIINNPDDMRRVLETAPLNAPVRQIEQEPALPTPKKKDPPSDGSSSRSES